ncbi:MAG: hypothetical protein EZS28_038483 [Streblomastix strix]|uniref:Tyr recombinase domain-containing protein n=1 Tax=Streblomastix strix TaxID=222440 RepID=A0A5J4U6X4_9EUKA|nr:MAG: hypothetical protein EZS28_038483 [Streblomastix strix]
MRGFYEEGVNLLVKRQRFNTVERDFYSQALLQNWLDIEIITIEEMMKKDAEVIITEVITFRTRQNNSVASAKSHKACLTTMLSLVYRENLASSINSKLINKALANATIPHRRFQNIWNTQILFNHWRQSKQNNYLNIYDLQVNIASLLMSICFFRRNEIAEIRLKFLNVNKTENHASLRLAPKQANAIETYEVYETDNEKLSPNLQLTKLLRELKIVGTSAYSIRHSATTELAKLGQDNEKLYQVSQQRGEIKRDGGNQLLSSSPLETGICIPTRDEIEIRRQFPRELKDRTSGMMLKVGWSAWNDDAEIRTLLCQSLISLIQRIIDKEMLSTSCIDEYEGIIDE